MGFLVQITMVFLSVTATMYLSSSLMATLSNKISVCYYVSKSTQQYTTSGIFRLWDNVHSKDTLIFKLLPMRVPFALTGSSSTLSLISGQEIRPYLSLCTTGLVSLSLGSILYIQILPQSSPHPNNPLSETLIKLEGNPFLPGKGESCSM